MFSGGSTDHLPPDVLSEPLVLRIADVWTYPIACVLQASETLKYDSSSGVLRAVTDVY